MIFDVAIVGAGPAGSAAAIALAKEGVNVALIEKAALPRYKTCGGGILRRAARLLPVDITPVIERECFAAELHHHNPKLSFGTHRPEPVVSMVMRDRFDYLLTSAAQSKGALLFERTSITSVCTDERAVDLISEGKKVRARFVIAADGANSAVARCLGAGELKRVVPALECEVKVEPSRFAAYAQVARFDFGLVPFGYAWVFPKGEHLSIGVLSVRRGAANLHHAYEQYLEHLGLSHPLAEERHGYMIPLQPRRAAFAFSRVLFVGDAAGFADPITAEGITAAILSGQLAAGAILRGNFDPGAVNSGYREALRQQLRPDLWIARVLAHILYECPVLRGWLFKRYGSSLSELMTDIVTGKSSYCKSVQAPRNYLRLLRMFNTLPKEARTA